MGEKDALSLDDRSPFAAAEAIVETILETSADLDTEDKVMAAMLARTGVGSEAYLRAIADSGSWVFYHQIQHLYRVGRDTARPGEAETFCGRAGRTFLSRIFADNIAHILIMAEASPHEFQETLTQLLVQQIVFYAGGKYIIDPERGKSEIVLRFRYVDHEGMDRYLRPFGLEVNDCLRHSVEFIGGAMHEFSSRIIQDYREDDFELSFDGTHAAMHLPIGNTDRFDYQAIAPFLVKSIGMLKEKQAKSRRFDHLESGLIAESDLMRDLWARTIRASKSDEIVLLRGESGTGKSFLARQIHEHSRRAGPTFVEAPVTSDVGSDNLALSNLFGHEKGAYTDAGEQKDGLFSLADGGTIFLDEIGDASPDLQAKLLRVLETCTFKRLGSVHDIEVDVRIIAATNRDLEEMVEQGEFRRDLYYRLNLITLELPPLRERRDDIPALAEFLVERAQERQGAKDPKVLAPGLADRLRAYAWPGNIRELEYALRSALALSDGPMIEEDDLPAPIREALADAPDPGPRGRGLRRLEGGII
ncbi:MAG: sigma-54 dependent transcriptional regulator, partial [Planctomycetota bacterium]